MNVETKYDSRLETEVLTQDIMGMLRMSIPKCISEISLANL